MIARFLNVIAAGYRWVWSWIRKALLRSRYPGITFGRNLYLSPGVRLKATDGGTITIEADNYLSDHVQIIAKWGHIRIGARSFIGFGTHISSTKRVDIGSDALIAEFVTVRDHDHDITLLAPARNASSIVEPIVIASNVWLAAKVTVTSGSEIGVNSVIGANSVVRGSIPADVVAAGAPAIVKKGIRSPDSALRDLRGQDD